MSDPAVSSLDQRLMRFAIALGARNNGVTWPNPAVGAVLVDEQGSGLIIATGRTEWGGRPHAERLALAEAGDAARAATLYVSLEPCSHHGRTPPCVDAIVAAGVRRVVTAVMDPDTRVAGRGHALLRQAGISVETDLCGREASRAHRGHVSRVTRGRPWLTLKLAQTPDGLAGRKGARLKITGDAADARTHMLRAHSDAILVGASTVLADDPRLDVRLPGLEHRLPVRVAVDSHLRMPLAARLVATAGARPTWVLCVEDAPRGAERDLCQLGVEVKRLPAEAGTNRVDLSRALACLGERGITRLLCEGGPALAEALASADLIDELILMTGSEPLGSNVVDGVPTCGLSLTRALRTRFHAVARETLGPDLIETFERL